MTVDVAAIARRALPLVDLTHLADSTPADIEDLCARAVGPHGSTAAVCVWPPFVAQAHRLLAASTVRVATVVNFPDGGTDIVSVVGQTIDVLEAGADEVDLVLPYRAFLAGDHHVAAEMVAAVRSEIDLAGPGRLLKVILESGEYPGQPAIADAAALVIDQGADFVKTSTGKRPVSATPEAVATILQVIRRSGRPAGVKPAGGIRTVSDAAVYLGLADTIMGPEWASPATFRFGASGLLDALEAAIEGRVSDAEPPAY